MALVPFRFARYDEQTIGLPHYGWAYRVIATLP
jgi:hypothetical protein